MKRGIGETAKGILQFNIGPQYWKTGRQLEYWKLVYWNIITKFCNTGRQP